MSLDGLIARPDGSVEILRLFMAADLIDEYQVFVHSVALGTGIPLFPAGTRETRLHLKEAARLDTQFVRLTYVRSVDVS
jgi:dihydrofolate reductase